ncbi:MAG: type II secretion system F family protein [Zoogloeaceae bacterium]|nr:type II secretion system F family protein [Rhodocyclaceae bacterium]MCP5234763.1 type II secretion system F family protein [Zoogloeaceae bacterium]
MAVFAYKAMNPDGQLVRGELEAANLVDLEMRLKRMELDFINGSPLKPTAFGRSSPAPRRELINFCFHLEQLRRAEVPILEGLSDLRDSTDHPRFREIMAGVVEGIEGGKSLSAALEDYPQAFDPVFCNLVRAGEASGNLPHVLRDLAESLKRDDELAAYASRIVIYPAIVLTFLFAAVTVALIFVVPELAQLFRSTGQALPLQTRILVGTSDLMQAYWPFLLTALVLAISFGTFAIQRSPAVRLRFDALTLHLPLFGEIRRKIIMARFAGLFAMMYSSGIPIIDALRSTEKVVGNRVIQRALQRIGQHIAEGQNVSAAFAGSNLFPPLVTRMLRVGENTGALDTALTNLRYFYDRDVQESTARLQAVLEPMLIALLAAFLLWIAVAVMGPIYDIITTLPV